jgi:hypothetical protein
MDGACRGNGRGNLAALLHNREVMGMRLIIEARMESKDAAANPRSTRFVAKAPRSSEFRVRSALPSNREY